MMAPPVFATVANDTGVQSLLGADPVRLWPFGEAGVPSPVLPYAIWQLIGGNPENYLGTLPDIDYFPIQIDVYALTASQAREVALVLRSAIEPFAHVTGYNGEFREVDTRNYRYSFNVDWFVNR